MDSFLASSNCYFMDSYPILRVIPWMWIINARKNHCFVRIDICFESELGTHYRLIQINTIKTQIDSVVSIIDSQKKNASEQISKVAKQYGLIEWSS